MFRVAIFCCLFFALFCQAIEDFALTSNTVTDRSTELSSEELPSKDVDKEDLLLSLDEKVSWYGARKFCRQKGKDVVTVENQEKYDLLVKAIKQTNLVNGTGDFWTSGFGGSRIKKEEKEGYLWMATGDLVDKTSNLWEHNPETFSVGCLELHGGDKFKLRASACRDKKYVACQKNRFGV